MHAKFSPRTASQERILIIYAGGGGGGVAMMIWQGVMIFLSYGEP